jgi:hypothetical protein
VTTARRSIEIDEGNTPMATTAAPASVPLADSAGEGPREQTRACYPDSSGYTERDGVRLYYEVYGSGEPTVFLLPTWSIIHSRHWKMQWSRAA